MDYASVDVMAKAAKVRCLLMDVDGVLTDGRIIYDDAGTQIKFFHVRDGHGLKLMKRSGIETGVITGRTSEVVELRARELDMGIIHQGVKDKREVIDAIIAQGRFASDEIGFVGDDIVDIPVFRRVGLRVAVPDAVDELRDMADYITLNHAGRGAVREVCEIILRARGLWQGIVDGYNR